MFLVTVQDLAFLHGTQGSQHSHAILEVGPRPRPFSHSASVPCARREKRRNRGAMRPGRLDRGQGTSIKASSPRHMSRHSGAGRRDLGTLSMPFELHIHLCLPMYCFSALALYSGHWTLYPVPAVSVAPLLLLEAQTERYGILTAPGLASWMRRFVVLGNTSRGTGSMVPITRYPR